MAESATPRVTANPQEGPRCWAEDISPCEGGISREHIVSKNLFPHGVTLRGFKWCENEFKTVGSNSFVAKILCRKHNSELSVCDQAAQRMHKVVQWVRAPYSFTTDGLDRVEPIDGLLFARWMAKTACNLLHAGGEYLPIALTRCAFAQEDDRRIGVYLIADAGDRFAANDNHVGAGSIHEIGNREGILFWFLFRGIPWVVGTTDLAPAETELMKHMEIPRKRPGGFLPRPAKIIIDVNGVSKGVSVRKGSIEFSW